MKALLPLSFRTFFNKITVALSLLVCFAPSVGFSQLIVMQSDFGLRDAAVSAMKLVIHGVDNRIAILDNTHEIEPFQIYEGAYRLYQSAPFAKPGTVYVSVVDPGVGSQRLSLVARDNRGVYYVTPDNGTLTFIEKEIGLSEVRVIDELRLRRPGSENSHTFHGRDIYAYVAALLASGQLAFADVGVPLDPTAVKRFVVSDAKILGSPALGDESILSGIIEIHDIRYGNIWTNIPESLEQKYGLREGEKYKVSIYKDNLLFKELELPFLRSFAAAANLEDKKLLYMNSLGKVACSELLGNLAKATGVGFGPNWRIEISR
jgi:S-adenosylmethionine hydrolase